ncbi:MAG: GGDEF domain-containing protein [Alphaproteobacteria bacterium]
MKNNLPNSNGDFRTAAQKVTREAVEETSEQLVGLLQGKGIQLEKQIISECLMTSSLAEQVERLAWELFIAQKKMQVAEEKALRDPMTGAYNREGYKERLNLALQRLERSDGYVMLAISDIDNFKNINDTYGHPFGDEVIKTVVKKLTHAVRKDDVVARIGGEEIAVIVEAKSMEDIKQLQTRLEGAVCQFQFTYDGTAIDVGNSIGVAVTDHLCNAKNLYKFADTQLYAVKKSGKKGRLLAQHMKPPANDPALQSER